jgi:hypothetical protein
VPGPPALLARLGDHLFLDQGDGRPPRSCPIVPPGMPVREGVSLLEGVLAGLPPPEWSRRVRAELAVPEGPLEVSEGPLAALVRSWGLRAEGTELARLVELRRKAHGRWSPLPRGMRLALTQRQVARRLSSPEEQLILLSKELDRLERLREREGSAQAHLAPWGGDTTPLGAYLKEAGPAVTQLEQRSDELGRLVDLEARRLLPNASALVGPRTAARLLAAAGGQTALLRLTASRLQRLGARPRGGPDHGPKHGVLYRAEGMGRVPASRRGALARTLASLLGPALRADLMTGGSLGPAWLERRERRVGTLARTGARRGVGGPRGGPGAGRASRRPRRGRGR